MSSQPRVAQLRSAIVPLMGWKDRVNRAVGLATGYEFRRVRRRRRSSAGQPARMVPPATGSPDRLLPSPVFVFCSVRSGSTLLRVVLNSHPQVFAPHEVHLRHLRVREATERVTEAMRALGLNHGDLEHLLWDRVMHHELQRSGKQIFVNKTPGNAFIWRRIAKCWPEAKYIFLLRHPLAIATSWHGIRPRFNLDEAARDVLHLMNFVEEARRELSGLTVRYEDLTSDPLGETRRICEFLDVPWTPAMLEYGEHDQGRFKAGLGDWGEKIESGRVQPTRPLPEPHEVPETLRDLCEAWGYLGETSKAV